MHLFLPICHICSAVIATITRCRRSSVQRESGKLALEFADIQENNKATFLSNLSDSSESRKLRRVSYATRLACANGIVLAGCSVHCRKAHHLCETMFASTAVCFSLASRRSIVSLRLPGATGLTGSADDDIDVADEDIDVTVQSPAPPRLRPHAVRQPPQLGTALTKVADILQVVYSKSTEPNKKPNDLCYAGAYAWSGSEN